MERTMKVKVGITKVMYYYVRHDVSKLTFKFLHRFNFNYSINCDFQLYQIKIAFLQFFCIFSKSNIIYLNYTILIQYMALVKPSEGRCFVKASKMQTSDFTIYVVGQVGCAVVAASQESKLKFNLYHHYIQNNCAKV